MTLELTSPGVPSIYAGDENGLEGSNGEAGRRTIDWDNQNSWDQDFLKGVKSLIQLRRTSHALINGGLRWLDIADDYLLFARESKEESLLIFISRTGVDIEIDLDGLGVKLQKTLFGVEQSGSHLRINSTTATQGIWQIKS